MVAVRTADVSGEPGWEKPSLGASFPQKTPFKADTSMFTALVSWGGEKDCG